jgi:hypothetical protein
VGDLWPGTDGSDPTGLADGEGTLYLAATDPTIWRELFRVGPPALVFVDGFESGDLTGWQ